MPLGHLDLLLDQVHSCDKLGNWVLDLVRKKEEEEEEEQGRDEDRRRGEDGRKGAKGRRALASCSPSQESAAPLPCRSPYLPTL